MPQVSPTAWSRTAAHVVIALCAFTLLATAIAAGAGPVAATDYTGAISVNRSGQHWAESAMLAQDQVLVALNQQKKASAMALKQAKSKLNNSKQALAKATTWLRSRRERRTQAEAALAVAKARAAAKAEADKQADTGTADPTADPPDDPAAPAPAAPAGPTLQELNARVDALAALVKDRRQGVKAAEKRRAKQVRKVRLRTRSVKAKEARLRTIKRQKQAAIARRESAEASLGYRIVQMERLAAARVKSQASVSYAGSTAFSWPALGRIVQVYGCTGYHENPRRGSCRHFHDGIDIVNTYGSAIRSVGVGVVAYSGWNPWDEKGRAWIVIVVHPDGWITRYGHLTPTSHARVGELVHTGQIIGKMGSTGNSSGTHLHFELVRNGSDVNPLAYLPSGVVKIRIDKTTTKAGKAKAQKKAKKVKARKKARASKKARKQAAAEAVAREVAAMTAVCEPVLRFEEPAGDVHDISYMMDAFDTGACVPAVDAAEDGLPPGEMVGRARLVDLPTPVAEAQASITGSQASITGSEASITGSEASVSALLRGTSPIPA